MDARDGLLVADFSLNTQVYCEYQSTSVCHHERERTSTSYRFEKGVYVGGSKALAATAHREGFNYAYFVNIFALMLSL